jgi:hypothetical protein
LRTGKTMRELPLPIAPDADDAHEMIRFWILDGESHLSLNIGLFAPEDEARMFGSMLADIALHAVRGMTQANPDLLTRKTELFAEMDLAYRERLTQSPEPTGTLQGSRH